MTYDDVLRDVGGFGIYQKKMCFFIFCSTFTCAVGTLTMIYTLYQPDHRCYIPGEDAIPPVFNEPNAFLFIPNVTKDDKTSHSKCNRYTFAVNSTNGTGEIFCDHGWVFDEPQISSVMSEFQIVCSRSFLKPLTVSLFMFGEALGSFLGGGLSDKYGRRPLLVWGKMIEFLLYFLVGFAPSMTMYIVIMTVVGSFVYLPYTTAFVLGNELMPKKHRNTVSLSVYGGYCTGAAVVPLMGYLLSDWRWLMRASGLFGILYIPFYWIIPESPYWLLSSGKYKEAMKVLAKIAKANGSSFSEGKLEQTFLQEAEDEAVLLRHKAHDEEEEAGLWKLLRSSSMRARLLVAYLSWIVTNMVYYGLALNITALSGDRFWNAAISGLLEYPGILCGFFIILWIGRPISLSALMGIGGVCLAVAPFIEAVNATAMTALVIFGKTALIGAFYINFSITGEMAPTLYRNIVVGSSSAVGKIGSFTAPYLMYLGETTSRSLPFLVMGCLALLSAGLSLLVLPETKGTTLPDTIKDAEALQPRVCGKKTHQRTGLHITRSTTSL